MHTQGIEHSHAGTAAAVADGGAGPAHQPEGGLPAAGGARTAPLRVDAQRNLEHVLRAAREVFGELGYGAPMEDVARRARVGVGTVYRRFPSKDVLVRRIADEETARLTEQARGALVQEADPWAALSYFLRTSVASGAGRLLPPQILRADSAAERAEGAGAPVTDAAEEPRVPQQRGPHPESEESPRVGGGGLRLVGGPADEGGSGQSDRAAELLGVVSELVERARSAGELRSDIAVSDVLLVIATAAPALPDAAQQAAASDRLLDILLEGLRSGRQ